MENLHEDDTDRLKIAILIQVCYLNHRSTKPVYW